MKSAEPNKPLKELMADCTSSTEKDFIVSPLAFVLKISHLINKIHHCDKARRHY